MIQYTILEKVAGENAIIEDNENFFFKNLTISDIEIRMNKSLTGFSLGKATDIYKIFIQNSVIDPNQYQQDLMNKVFDEINQMLSIKGIKYLPRKINLVVTNGREEFNKAYTRNRTIFTPDSYFRTRDYFQLLAYFTHEIFHIFSRLNQPIRNKLYSVFGFNFIDNLKISDELKSRKINNPDATNYEFGISLNNQIYVPYISVDEYPIPLKKSAYEYINTRYYLLQNNGISTNSFVKIDSIKGIYQQNIKLNLPDDYKHMLYDSISYNTGYIMHPEEICADNYSLLLIESLYPEVYNNMSKKGKVFQNKMLKILKK